MTTYNTFAECLKNHPTEKVMTSGSEWCMDPRVEGMFLPMNLPDGGRCSVVGEKYWVEANPADHLMTLEEFFDEGYEFSIGDSYLGESGLPVIIGDEIGKAWSSKRNGSESNRYVLSAACFGGGSHPEESKAVEVNVKEIDFSKAPEGATHYGVYGCDKLVFFKVDNGVYLYYLDDHWSLSSWSHHDWLTQIPRMRTEYVKDERTINEIAKAMIDGEVFYNKVGDEKFYWDSEIGRFSTTPYVGFDVAIELYKKVHTQIDERQEFIDAFTKMVTSNHEDGNEWSWDCIAGYAFDAGFRKPE